ncbi:restriction endonuclease subunit R, partial [Candidatus Poribacteria bacterium]|nr:restriction endonuclease subunit R [Candidatus Poribacteria bacterium]
MKIKFKDQPYQIDAVNSVVDCFAGQLKILSLSSHIGTSPSKQTSATDLEEGFKNPNITLSEENLLENIKKVQHRQNLPLSKSLVDFSILNEKGKCRPVRPDYKRDALAASRVHLDIEMETGTGKTYCYIKTIFEMHNRYGWSKFIVIVPSIAIREGVYKSLEITAEHFSLRYGNKARFFIYNSRRLHELEDFSTDAG